jgi:tRNA (guanine37-N1)-methyltransferase
MTSGSGATTMRVDVLTLFPGIFQGYLEESLVRKARDKGILDIRLWNWRDWAEGPHKTVDDRPYGGGPGMVLMCEPLYKAVEAVQREPESPEGRLVMLTPSGERLTQARVAELSAEKRLVLLCGRYEGFDERVRQGLKPLEISVGDFICNGGEAPAMVLIDAVARLLPGFLGDPKSAEEESHSVPGLLEYPHYTRPRVYRGMETPQVLLDGNHEAIRRWRHQKALERSGNQAGGTD